MVFRSTELSLPLNALGWDYGTLEVLACTAPEAACPASLHGLRLKLRTSINRGKIYPADAAEGIIRWAGKKDRYVRLPVQRRYSSCLVVEFRKNRLGLDQTPAFAILWLQDIPDEQYSEVSLPIFGGGKSSLKRAELNCDCNLGEQIGSITINVKFWRGMGRYHQRLGSNNPGVQDVLEVLSTAQDSKEVTVAMAEDENGDGSDSSSSSSESDVDFGEAPGFRREFKASLTGKNTSTGDGAEDSGGGPLKQFREYTNHSDQLHQHHRGLMQWKVIAQLEPPRGQYCLVR